MPRPASAARAARNCGCRRASRRPRAEQMAHRVDAPGRLMRHEDPDHPAPEQSLERAPSAVEREADRGRQREAQSEPQQIEPVRQRGRPVANEIGYVAPVSCGCGSNSQPTCARQNPANPGRFGPCGSCSVSEWEWWRRWVAAQNRTGPFAGGRAESGEEQPQRRSALERPVREIAMKADLDADRAAR
jgi:hypothetical protein